MPSTISLQVSAAGTPVTAIAGESVVTLTATVVAGAAPVSPGQVNFCEVKPAPLRCTDIRLLGMAQLTSAGVATLRFRPGAGTHIYQAVFLGTHAVAGSASSQPTLTVSDVYPTVTTITYTTFLGYGTYTMDVTVTGLGGTVAPTGNISILDTSNGNYPLATAPLLQGPTSVGGNVGSVTFSAPVTYFSPAFDCAFPADGIFPNYDGFAAADFNGDGVLDVAVATNYSISADIIPNPCPLPPPGTMNLLSGNGDGNFTQVSNATVGSSLGSVTTADFNGDGKPDLVVAVGGNTLQVLLGNGDGTFTTGQVITGAAATSVGCLAVGDFNNDGNEDLAVCNQATGAVSILLGNGDGTFNLKGTIATDSKPSSIAVGDLLNNGKLDLVVANAGAVVRGVSTSAGSVSILFGQGDGTFTVSTNPSTGASPSAVSLADFNGDGILDLAVANAGTLPYNNVQAGSLQIMRGFGTGLFLPVSMTTQVSGLNALSVGDFNGDGIADLAIAFTAPANGGQIWTMQGNGDGTFAAQSLIPQTQGGPTGIIAADFNGDGMADIGAPCDNTPEATNSYFNVLIAEQQATSTAVFSTTEANNFFVVGEGLHYAVAAYAGDVNFSSSVSGTEGVTAEPELNSLTVAANPASSNYQQPVTLSATPSPDTAQNHNATGTVTFTFGKTVLGTSPLVGGTAVLATAVLPAGADTVTAAYSGDTNFAVSKGSVVETVNGSQTVTTLGLNPNPSLAGQMVNFAATVSGVSFGQPPTGTVTFYAGTTALAQVPLSATGTATYSTSFNTFGSYAITAAYSGDAEFYASTSTPVTLVVNANPSMTALTASPNPAGVGEAVTLTAAVGGTALGGIARGTVSFLDGGISIGTATLDATGHATLTTKTLALGTHVLTVVYGGSPVYSGSTSGSVNEVIQKPDFTLSVSTPSMTLQEYQHTTTNVTLTSMGDFADNINLACNGAPANLTCVFTPTQAALTPEGTVVVSLYVDTDSILGGNFNGPLHSSRAMGASPIRLALVFGPLSLLGAVFSRRRRFLGVVLLMFCAALPFALTGCGGSQIVAVPGVAPGTYTISVTGTGATSGVNHSAQVTLMVTKP